MGEVMALGPGVSVGLSAVVFCAAILERLAGQGFGMLAAPLFALIVPAYLPATILLVGLLVGLSSTALDLRAARRAEVIPGFAGRLFGAVLAAGIALMLTEPAQIASLVALLVYLGIGLSLVGIRVEITPVSLFSAGTVGGIMGTLTGVGAPPMALLYQRVEARRSAAMQNLFFFWGMSVSIPALALVGLIETRHLVLAAFLTPMVPLAMWASRPASRWLAGRSIRPLALSLAGAAATVLLLRQLL